MIESVAATIARYAMFQHGQRLGVAVSGGADSVCLLHVLIELAPRWDLRLHVLHLDHQLRGPESRADAEFVCALARSFALPATIRTADIAGAAGNLEQAGRRARLAFFREMVSTGAVHRVAAGHTRNDQAETVLFRFLRGSGSAGLAGIRPVTGSGIVRPLIETSREEIEEFLRARGIAWREDATNRTMEFARNRIRHHLLPQLEREWNPAVIETLARTAEWAQAEESYWESEIAQFEAKLLLPSESGVLVHAEALEALPRAVARRLVRRAIERIKGDLRGIEFSHIDQMADLASGDGASGRVLAAGIQAERSLDWIRFTAIGPKVAEFRSPALVPGVMELPSGARLSLELIDCSKSTASTRYVYNEEETSFLDWFSLSGPLEIRSWKPGDRYQPWGTASVRKLKTFFQQARIPRWERNNWPVLTSGSEIIWSRRFGPAAAFRARPESRMLLVVREQYESRFAAATSKD